MTWQVAPEVWIGFARCEPAVIAARGYRQQWALHREAANRAVAVVIAASGLNADCATSRSHTHGAAAAVAAPAGVRVGVDLVEPERVTTRHAHAVLNGDEWEVLSPYAGIRPALAWALKEAAAKASGDPLRCFPHGLRIETCPSGLMVREVAGVGQDFVGGWGLFRDLLYAWVYEGGGTRTDDLGITRQEVLEGFRQFSYGL
jgi:hypothetical protein